MGRDSAPSWAFLTDGFRWDDQPTAFDWNAVLAVIEARRRLDGPLLARLRRALQAWNERLEPLDGDPLQQDWGRFRSLRRDREEDWSDWLAHLIETSATGRFAAFLLRRPASGCVGASAEREVVVSGAGEADRRRLDLRITWLGGGRTHVEVKIRDTQFDKTFDTAALHRAAIDTAECDDWILIPRALLPLWTLAADRASRESPTVTPLFWEDVATGLRRSLCERRESLTWRVWARALAGCIERDILNFPLILTDELELLVERIEIKGLVEHLEGSLDGAE